ncbi:putative phospholipid-hydroperoxide glutathione peroxidase [Helianthus annuus]|nr:putative phospholipid-hydroperoxide glutathione peroxidase [Helianthus annuus]
MKTDVKGQDVALSKYRGKVSLIVNVAGSPRYASRFRFIITHYHFIIYNIIKIYSGYNADWNPRELTILHDEYKHKGFEILAFPCNQFGHQEPGSNEEFDGFACIDSKLEYPVFSKVNVNGKYADPLYEFLKARIGGISGARIKGNFTKFLVNREGQAVRRFAPNINPLSFEVYHVS